MPESPGPSPQILRQLTFRELAEQAQEIRHQIISTCLRNGGHLGASLGAVDIALALHRCMNSPEEPIIWDVGHQAYAHKLLTGRWNQFETLRQKDGISGFPMRGESEHDVFGAGHAGTALSAALAAAWVRRGTSRWTTAVLGDAALTCGLTLEALLQADAHDHGPLLVVLNDNHRSISTNVGSFSRVLGSSEVVSVFRSLGWDYQGPIDGHDLASLVAVLDGTKEAADTGKPPRILLHVITEKGKGYAPAEEDPTGFHGVSPVAGRSSEASVPQSAWSAEFGRALVTAAEVNPAVVAVCAAMVDGTGLGSFARANPERIFDVGIAEGHAVTFAAGLAAQGARPVVAIYSTFMQRAVDSVIHDIALQGLPVVLALDRAGIVGADGPTHHGNWDLSIFLSVPGLRVMSPASPGTLRALVEFELARQPSGPVLFRFPRGRAPELPAAAQDQALESLICVREAEQTQKLLVFALGPSWSRALEAVRLSGHESACSIYAVQRADDIQSVVSRLAATAARMVTVEDGAVSGGFGERLGAALLQQGWNGRFKAIGYPREFLPHGDPSELERQAGVDSASIAGSIRELLEASS